MKLDYHIHTKLCKHASGQMAEYVEQALKLGFDEIAFTDHIPLPQNFDPAHRMSLSEIDFYLNEIEKLKTRFGKDIKILTGIEADFYDGFEDYLADFLNRFPMDIVILSVHFIRDWPAGNWTFSYYFPGRPLKEIYSDYLQALMRGVKTGLFNVLGHLDLIKRDEARLLDGNEQEVRQLLGLVRQQNMAVEINTSGLRKEIGEPYPHQSIWPLLAEFQLPVTMGSDAHAPNQVGFRFAEIERQLVAVPGLQKARCINGNFEIIDWSFEPSTISK
ncbi:MAG TPA: histidinol-phosphatase HisJ [Caldithrix abyssi]|uniref:Histidinol-phosphatase n=1 Tax=Caldithrix abyssi TaxID=187145 RepID=A0A7V5H4M3_CALAY|nr:histidinol-phosphatase HisJ [Caldithrix abyssi]